MPTITHIFKTYFPDTQGGIEEAIRQIGKYSLKNGYKIKIISISKKPSNSILDDINCYSYEYSLGPKSMPISIKLATSFNEIIKETDILQLHYPFPYGELLTLIFNVKKPIIITFHSEIMNWPLLNFLYQPFARMILNKAKVIVPTSYNLFKSTKTLGKYKSKIEIINLWLDESRFENLQIVSDKFKNQVRDYSSFSLFIGVLRWYKGLDILLDAAKTVKGNIVIAGNGPLKEHLEKRIKEEQISNVIMTGYLSDNEISYLFQKCKFTVLPSISRGEAFGQVLLESCFYSKAMITTELGTGTSYVNLDNETGLVVPPKDSIELSKSMNKLFFDAKLCEFMGSNAYKRYKNNFTESIQGEKYITLYNKLNF